MNPNHKFDPIFTHGSRWFRVDFHLHTKSDTEFTYEGARDNDAEFAERYIEQLKSQGIGIGVITNHNKFNLREFKTLTTTARREGIFLLPGIEMSLPDGASGIHALIAFDYSWISNKENANYIQTFLDSAFVGKPNYGAKPYKNANFKLTEVVSKLDVYQKDYFIVLAHVDDDNGLFKELDGRNLQEFTSTEAFKSRVLGLQKVRSAGSRARAGAIALVEGTDNAAGGISAIGCGTGTTYMKVGDFNFSSIKYAMRDFGARLRGTPDCKPINAHVLSIRFEGGKLSDQEISFSPELNCLIGIRGSGKSSALELLRYGLGIPLTDTSADPEYKNDLIGYMLGSGGKVILDVRSKNGKQYRIEKIYGQRENIYDEGGNLCDVSVDAVFGSPIYFGQKDLSNKKAGFQSDLLNRLVGRKLDEVRKRIASKANEVESTILELQKLRNLKGEREDVEQTVKNSEHALQMYKEHGVSEKLASQTQFDKDSVVLSRTKETLGAFVSALNEVVSDYSAFFTRELPPSTQNGDLFAAATKSLDDGRNGLALVKQGAALGAKGIQGFDAILAKLAEKRMQMQEEFAKIKRELNSETLNPDTFLKLTRSLEVARLKLEDIAKREHRRDLHKKRLVEQLAGLNDLWNEEFRLLQGEIARINAVQGKLRLDIKFKGRRDLFFEKMKSLFRGTGIKEATYQRLSDDFADFIEMYRDWSKVKTYMGETQQADFARRFGEHLLELLVFKVENAVSIEYEGKSIDRLSLGQRASALILFLLAQQDGDVLIIDQPEDDLDNQIIYDEVIKQMIQLKGRMQFIFATHNPNMPVLGDAEKVLAFRYDDGKQIEVEAGTIDTPTSQQAIVGIMEGGQAAFEKRNKIYGMWR